MTSFSSGFTAASIRVSLMVCQRKLAARRLTAPASFWLFNWIGLPNFVNCFSICGGFTPKSLCLVGSLAKLSWETKVEESFLSIAFNILVNPKVVDLTGWWVDIPQWWCHRKWCWEADKARLLKSSVYQVVPIDFFFKPLSFSVVSCCCHCSRLHP